jgi:hypothetical protein
VKAISKVCQIANKIPRSVSRKQAFLRNCLESFDFEKSMV